MARALARRARALEQLALDRLRAGRGALARLHRSSAPTLGTTSVASFADSWAQTVCYGLLAARWLSGAQVPFDRAHVPAHLPSTSPALREQFERFVAGTFDAELRAEIDGLFALLADAPLARIFADEPDPAIHFYQDFLDAHDPRARKRAGVWSTPDEVVAYMVESVDRLLIERFGLRLGLADTSSWATLAQTHALELPVGLDPNAPFVSILDPAAGTGTFLLKVIERVHRTMLAEYARVGLDERARRRAWRAYVRAQLLPRLHGFELMPAPLMVCHLRLGLALQRTGFSFTQRDHLRVSLANTLEQPANHSGPPTTVVLGNPPYERESADSRQHAGRALLEDYLEPVRRAGRGIDLKPAYNRYVYFWRWAQSRVFETPPGLGIVSLVTASSYLRGPGFAGMRASLRRAAERIEVLDLEGDQKAARKSENVFDIMIPVAATTLVRGPSFAEPSVVYHRLEGSRADKLAACARFAAGGRVPWSTCPTDADAPLVAGTNSSYTRWPLLTDVFPWQHTGAEFQRNWAIAETREQLQRRWRALLRSDDRAADFRESRDRKLDKSYEPLFVGDAPQPPIASLGPRAAMPRIEPYLFRAFDRRWCFADARIGTVLKPVLWNGRPQLFMLSLLTKVLGAGPAATLTADVPDRDAFCGRGGKDVIPLWRDPSARVANVCQALQAELHATYDRALDPDELFAYAYAVLANPGYVRRFVDELQIPGPRLPLTRNRELFDRGVALGRELLRRHAGAEPQHVGAATLTAEIPSTPGRYPQTYRYDPARRVLEIGDGRISNLAPELWAFCVSGLQVLKSWLDHRTGAGAGRRSSALDDIRPRRWTAELTDALLELLWLLEWTLEQFPVLDAWLDDVLAGPLFQADGLPQPSASERSPPPLLRALPQPSGITSAKQLALELAARAKSLRAAAASLSCDPDAYAQAITSALLAARWLNQASPNGREANVGNPTPTLPELLSTLGLPDPASNPRLAAHVDEIAELLTRTPVARLFEGQRDPSIHFFQDFLHAYDPQQRHELGVWSTPDDVVQFIVRAVDQWLRERLGLRLGLADPITWQEWAAQTGRDLPAGVDPHAHVVQLLDPAVGTGTFLLHALEHIFAAVRDEHARLGLDDVAAAAHWRSYVRQLLSRLHGFELMPAPLLVCHLRLGLALQRGLAERAGRDPARWGYTFGPDESLDIRLADTLAVASSAALGPVTIVLGNPPYDRVARSADAPAWLVDDLLAIAREHTVFSHHASLYNRYVYFWRWALWRVFEGRATPGVVALITPSSWLTGPGFVGLRARAREFGDEIVSIDLGGDNKGALREANVFDIESPVAVTMVGRSGGNDVRTPAVARYRKITGNTAEAKLAQLRVGSPLAGAWTHVSDGWRDPLVPAAGGASWLDMPRLDDLFPWQQPGCKFGRLWPIATSPDTLAQRWARLTAAPVDARPALFRTATSGRSVQTRVGDLPALAELEPGAPHRPIVRYGYRSFDRQWAFDDRRLAKTESPSLWASRSNRQIYLATMITKHIGPGPALTCSAHVPDLDYFCGRGGKDIIPLYRDAECEHPNVSDGLLDCLARELGVPTPTPADLAAYVYALLSCSHYQLRFAEPLTTPGPRVPVTRDPTLWHTAVTHGRRLLWLHTYAEGYRDPADGRGPQLPDVPGLRWQTPITELPARPSDIRHESATELLHVGDGSITGVSTQVWTFTVSGMPIVKKWLGYRTLRGAGKSAGSSNLLDQIRPTTWQWDDELLDLLRVLTATVAMQPELADLLDRVCAGPLIPAAALPTPAPAQRLPAGAGHRHERSD